MAKIYAIRESGMSPKDIPTKGYNNENINPAKKMSCAGVVLAGRALPRGKLKTIHRNRCKTKIPMYPKREYIGIPPKITIPMYPHHKIYQVLPKFIRLSNPRCYIAQTPSESPRKSRRYIGADLKQQIPMYSHMSLNHTP